MERLKTDTINRALTFNFMQVTVTESPVGPFPTMLCVGAGVEWYDGILFCLVRGDEGVLTQLCVTSFEIGADEVEKMARGIDAPKHGECYALNCVLCYGEV